MTSTSPALDSFCSTRVQCEASSKAEEALQAIGACLGWLIEVQHSVTIAACEQIVVHIYIIVHHCSLRQKQAVSKVIEEFRMSVYVMGADMCTSRILVFSPTLSLSTPGSWCFVYSYSILFGHLKEQSWEAWRGVALLNFRPTDGHLHNPLELQRNLYSIRCDTWVRLLAFFTLYFYVFLQHFQIAW